MSMTDQRLIDLALAALWQGYLYSPTILPAKARRTAVTAVALADKFEHDDDQYRMAVEAAADVLANDVDGIQARIMEKLEERMNKIVPS